jgi:hypothetical protein
MCRWGGGLAAATILVPQEQVSIAMHRQRSKGRRFHRVVLHGFHDRLHEKESPSYLLELKGVQKLLALPMHA